ncbi:MAG TPA: FCD domain-containing protein [Nocardioides sp.]
MTSPSGSQMARNTLTFLRKKITSGEWPVNSRIPIEPELMEMLGVGKTTVREAVRSLASLGMLETLPGRGTFVRSRTPVSSVITEFISDYSLAEILVYRRSLEIEAARQAAMHRTEEHLVALRGSVENDQPSRRDADYPTQREQREQGRTPGSFHFLVFEASGNRLLLGSYAGVMAALRRAIDRGEVVYGASSDVRSHDHAAILEAIAAQDPTAAAAAMGEHADIDLVVGAATEAPTEAPASV